MFERFKVASVAAFAVVSVSTTASAHFKLLAPTSWLKEGSDGAPQKGGPCGPGGFDDDGNPVMSMAVTTLQAGQMLKVEFEETVHHPGWFRISLAPNRSDFEDLKFTGAGCSYDQSKVPTGAHGNVLSDGIGKNDALLGDNRKFSEMVKIPDQPCEKCTLQVIQVMADTVHSPPNCVYYHCADVKIVGSGTGAAGSGSAAGSGAAGLGAAGAAAGSGAAGSGAAGSGAAGSGAAGATAGRGAAAGASGVVAAAGTSAMLAGTTGSGGIAAPASAGIGASAPTPSPTTPTPAAGTAASPNPVASAGTSAPSTGTVTNPIGAAGSSAAPAAPSSSNSSSCAAAQPGADAAHGVAWIFGAGMFLGTAWRRRRRQ